MIAFPSMLVSAAERAGMSVPPDPEDFDKSEYPRFAIFCKLQLARRMQPGEHWDNAVVIANYPEDKLKTATLEDFLTAGLAWSI